MEHDGLPLPAHTIFKTSGIICKAITTGTLAYLAGKLTTSGVLSTTTVRTPSDCRLSVKKDLEQHPHIDQDSPGTTPI